MQSYIETIFITLKEYDLLLAMLFIFIYWLLKRSTEKAIITLLTSPPRVHPMSA